MNNPEDPAAGTRKLPFSRELWIERDDFLEDPPQKFFRLAPGREVRLRFAYFVRCEEVVKDAERRGRRAPLQLRPRDPRRRRPRRAQGEGHDPLGLRARTRVPAEVRLYDPLFTVPDPMARRGPRLHRVPEPGVARGGARRAASSRRSPAPRPATRVQFERLGYFCADPDSTPARPVWNRTVTLRDSWAKLVRRGEHD